jgi:hypothetical protein
MPVLVDEAALLAVVAALAVVVLVFMVKEQVALAVVADPAHSMCPVIPVLAAAAVAEPVDSNRLPAAVAEALGEGLVVLAHLQQTFPGVILEGLAALLTGNLLAARYVFCGAAVGRSPATQGIYDGTVYQNCWRPTF